MDTLAIQYFYTVGCKKNLLHCFTENNSTKTGALEQKSKREVFWCVDTHHHHPKVSCLTCFCKYKKATSTKAKQLMFTCYLLVTCYLFLTVGRRSWSFNCPICCICQAGSWTLWQYQLRQYVQTNHSIPWQLGCWRNSSEHPNAISVPWVCTGGLECYSENRPDEDCCDRYFPCLLTASMSRSDLLSVCVFPGWSSVNLLQT